MRAGREIQRVPAHLRQAQAGRRHLGDLAVDPAEAGGDLVLQAALGHQLHADADAEERRAGAGCRLDRLAHAGHGGQAARAVGERALARQHDPVGAADMVRDPR